MNIDDGRRIEKLVADDVAEAMWLRLRRLTSGQLCKKIIKRYSASLSQDILDKKADGMAWAIRSALGYWSVRDGELNARILSRYYALLQVSIAELISSNDPRDDLSTIQRHTEYGHGLFQLSKEEGEFPHNYYIGCLNSGHFPMYCKKVGFDMQAYAHNKRPRDFFSVDQSKIYSLSDLLRRIPEFQRVIHEFIGSDPLSFHIGYATKNFRLKAQGISQIGTQRCENKDAKLLNSEVTYIDIFTTGPTITADVLNRYNLPIENIILEPSDSSKGESNFVGELVHPKVGHWWQHLDTYKSGYSGTSIILPFWGTADPFILHLSILFAFSIVVRYLPKTWHEIEYGCLDNMRALLEHYLSVIDNVLPKIAIERLTRTRLSSFKPI